MDVVQQVNQSKTVEQNVKKQNKTKRDKGKQQQPQIQYKTNKQTKTTQDIPVTVVYVIEWLMDVVVRLIFASRRSSPINHPPRSAKKARNGFVHNAPGPGGFESVTVR